MKLFIDASTRRDSRTLRLARSYLLAHRGPWQELHLSKMALLPLNEERLSKRMALLNEGNLAHPDFALARQFASAEEIVIAAPYYDLSFPSLLKLYLENIYIVGIVSSYDDLGRPKGQCKAKSLTYITTAGGPYDPRFSYRYIEELCKGYFGIPSTKLISVENLDILGVDAEAKLKEAEQKS